MQRSTGFAKLKENTLLKRWRIWKEEELSLKVVSFGDCHRLWTVMESCEWVSSLSYDAKHPVILPKKHDILKLVVAHIHNQGHHKLGVNFILAELWQKASKKAQRGTNHGTPTRYQAGNIVMMLCPLQSRFCWSIQCQADKKSDRKALFVFLYLCEFTSSSFGGSLFVGHSKFPECIFPGWSKGVANRK